MLIFAVVQPLVFLLLFSFVFGGGEAGYIQFIVPGLMVQTVILTSITTSVGLSLDLQDGLIDRFRSMPISRSAVLAGRAAADTVLGAFSLFILLAASFAIGFRVEDWTVALGGITLTVTFGFAFIWVGAAVGLFVRNPDAVQAAGFIWLLPLIFVSPIFTRTDSMAGWVRAIAENQPVGAVAAATQELMRGVVNPGQIALALIWTVFIFLLFFSLTIARYANVTAR